MVYVILGAPGSGKGTRSEILEEKLGVIHISTGSLIREDIEMYEKYREEWERGELLSDVVISEILKRKLEKDCIGKTCIIDGYPRTLKQAHILDRMIDDDSAIVTLLYGEATSKEEAEELAAYIEDKYTIEVELHNGGQPVYNYIFGVE